MHPGLYVYLDDHLWINGLEYGQRQFYEFVLNLSLALILSLELLLSTWPTQSHP